MKRSEEDIKKEILDSLYWDSRVDISDITVDIKGFEVTLLGTVPHINARRAAEDIAYGIPGVNAVINQIEVQPPSPTRTDKALQSNIENILSRKSDINESKINVTVNNGIATLRGTVVFYREKTRAEELTEYYTGVRGVINELSVVPTKKHKDEQIAKRIVDNLEHNIYTDASTVTVKVDNGFVTLSGTLPHYAQKLIADRAGRYVRGVRGINNLITVSKEQQE